MIFFVKFLKFVAVGFSGLFVDFCITYILKENLKFNQYLSNSAGFIFAASSNYVLNRLWTFKSQNMQISLEYASFISIAILGLVINNIFLYLLLNKINLSRTLLSMFNMKSKENNMEFYVSKFFAIVITTMWNFFANYFFTFQIN
jgi:putative flippase GtrA